MSNKTKWTLVPIVLLSLIVAVASAAPADETSPSLQGKTVAILIVDDFDKSHDLTLNNSLKLAEAARSFTEALPELLTLSDSDLASGLLNRAYESGSMFADGEGDLKPADTCVVNLPSLVRDGQGNYVKTGLSDSTLTLPHGIYVAEVAQETLNQLPNGGEIEVVPVDTTSYRTQDIYNEIIAVRNTLEAHGFTAFVINMSFAYIPCDPVLISALAYFDSVIGEVNTARLNGDISEDDAIRMFQAVLQLLVQAVDDPASPVKALVAQLSKCSYEDPIATGDGPDYAAEVPESCDPLQVLSSANTIAVAAAGNLGEKYENPDPRLNLFGMYPLAPALWSSVVSVGALDPAGGTNRAPYSNAAEVLMNGLTVDKATLNELSGTSFAAPRLSAVLANFLVDQGNVDSCRKNGQPALAYIGAQDWVDEYWNGTVAINDVNLDLPAAITNTQCTSIQVP